MYRLCIIYTLHTSYSRLRLIGTSLFLVVCPNLPKKSRNDISRYYLQFSVVDPLWRFSQLPLSKHKTNSRLSGDLVPIKRKFVND